MRKAVRTMKASAGMRRAKIQSRRFMVSPMARLAAIAEIYERKVGQLSLASDDVIAGLISRVSVVHPWAPAHGRLIAKPIEKYGGSSRWVYVPGPVDQATQLLVKWALEDLTDPEPTQFMSAGGRPAFERWLEKELLEAVLVFTTDIPSCFDNILRDGLKHDLPLPVWVQKAVMFDPKDQALFLDVSPGGLSPMDMEKVAKVSSAGRGIPQGTAPSSLVSEAVISPVIRAIAAVSPDVRVASYGDNLIMILRNAKDKVPAFQALMSSVEARFGHDVISRLTSRTVMVSPTVRFSFAGRDYRLVKGKMRVWLSPERIDRFAVKTLVRIQDAQRGKNPYAPAAIQRSIAGWATQNGSLPHVIGVALKLQSHLTRLFGDVGSGISNGSAEKDAEGDYWSAEDGDLPWVEACDE